MKKSKIIRIAGSVVILAVLVFLWGKQSDLAYNVAQQRDILLGRYKVDHVVTLIILTPILLLVLLGVWKDKKPRDELEKKKVLAKTIALTISIVISLVFVDVAMRLVRRQHYIKDGVSYHRAPNKVFNGIFQDKPVAIFSYPRQTNTYPDVQYTLTVDSQGFRNLSELADCDWLILGDSFAEGSGVDDEQVWPVILGDIRDKTISNLGMSGGSPVTYLDTLKKFGIDRKPETVICLLYEGNDFRDSNFAQHKLDDPKKATLFDKTFKASPLRRLMKDSLIRFLGPVDAKRFYNDPSCNEPGHPMYPVAWLPIQVPAAGGPSYTIVLKRVLQHFMTEDVFRKTLACTESLRLLYEAKTLCDDNDIELIVVYAPDKPHVLMNEVTRQVPAEQLYAFLDLKAKKLPAVGQLGDELNKAVNVRVNVIRKFCDESEIKFIDLTGPLKKATASGIQTYFTYDQHWTPDGHKVVAQFLSETIK